jgi:hypothetical protein
VFDFLDAHWISLEAGKSFASSQMVRMRGERELEPQRGSVLWADMEDFNIPPSIAAGGDGTTMWFDGHSV